MGIEKSNNNSDASKVGRRRFLQGAAVASGILLGGPQLAKITGKIEKTLDDWKQKEDAKEIYDLENTREGTGEIVARKESRVTRVGPGAHSETFCMLRIKVGKKAGWMRVSGREYDAYKNGMKVSVTYVESEDAEGDLDIKLIDGFSPYSE